MFSDHKILRNEEKNFIKNHETLFTIIFKKRYVFYFITVKQTDKIFIEKLLLKERNFIENISPVS